MVGMNDLRKVTTSNGNVDHPEHYGGADNPYEAIKVIEHATRDLQGVEAFDTGNALKYILRAPYKGKQIEDLEKAIWYLNHCVAYLKERDAIGGNGTI